MAKICKDLLKPRRSSSYSFGQRRPSVHWISPSVFEKVQKPVQDNAKVTLTQVFTASNEPSISVPQSSQQATTTMGKKNPKCRKHCELPKNSQEQKLHQPSKKLKVEEKHTLKQKENIEITNITNSPKKPLDPTKRLSFILNNDPYNVLGVSPSATKSTMKNAYKKKAIGMHPDKGGSQEEFIKLQSAYEVLIDDKYFFL